MKKSILVLLLLSIFISCNKNDDTASTKSGVVGNWELTEVLADPGDGSGIFNAVNSSKTLTFTSNGSVTSNGTLCDMSTTSNTSSTGTYSEATTTINPTNCSVALQYQLDGNTLVVIYPCIEPCKAKYTRIQ